jgi:MurNAc alpha-1-phosphate uridylyltransferase
MTGPTTAMVLAAGLGKRMRPITDRMPKPLVPVAGRSLLDRGLDRLAEAGVETAVVNVHHLGEQIIASAATRTTPRLAISDERDRLLDSAGGVVKALPLLGPAPFFVLNADTFWVDRGERDLDRLKRAWDPARMDILLMLAHPADATGHTGGTDFLIDADARLRRARGAAEGLVYAGAFIVRPEVFAGAAAEPHSLNLYFDRAIRAGRLFGLRMTGAWITVGTPDAIALAEARLTSLGAA